MRTTAPLPFPNTTEPIIPAYDQVVKGNVSIKKMSKHKYKITFSKIGKFLVYQVWDKDSVNLNKKRPVFYISAKKWINHFNDTNKDLKQKNKPLFTPTTVIEMEDQDDNYAFVIHKAYLNTRGHVVFTVSTKEINTSSKKLIKIPCGKFNNVRFDIDAPQNGLGIVYNKSDCGPLNVKYYGIGGEGPGSACDEHGLGYLQRAIVWYANPPSGNDKDNYNWSLGDIYGNNIAKVYKYNGWCDDQRCKSSENQNPRTYIPPKYEFLI
jgi:hypothetical protein